MLVGPLIPWTVELCYYKGSCNYHRGTPYRGNSYISPVIIITWGGCTSKLVRGRVGESGCGFGLNRLGRGLGNSGWGFTPMIEPNTYSHLMA